MGARVSWQALASTIGAELRLAAEEQAPCESVLGTFAFAGVVCQVRVPYSGWRITSQSKGLEVAGVVQGGFRLWGRFLTDKPPQLVAHVLVHPRANELAASVWNLCECDPGPAERKSFSCNGSDFLACPGMVVQFRRTQGMLDILLPSPDHISSVAVAVRFALALVLNDLGGVICHSAGLVSENKALVFFGVSESGKSTIARLSEADAVLSDEAVILHEKDHRWMASGTPFHSELVAGTNATAGLAALIKLTKAPFNRCRPLSQRIAAQELLKTACVLDDQPLTKLRCAENVLRAVERVPVYELEFRPERAVWPFVLREIEHASR